MQCKKKSISGYIGFDCTAKVFMLEVYPNNDFKIDAKIWT